MKKVLSITLVVVMLLIPCALPVSAEEISTAEKMEYVTYNLETGEETYSYYDIEPPAALANKPLVQQGITGTLPPIEPLNNMVSPRSVIGGEDRQPVSNYNILPYRAICFMEATFRYVEDGKEETANFRSTAWLFKADGAVCAGHSIYKTQYGGWAETVTIYPARTGNYKPYEVDVVEMGLATPYTESQDINYDYGLLKLDENIGNTVGTLTYAYNTGVVNNEICAIGYPGSVTYTPEGEKEYDQFESIGKITAVYTNMIRFDADISNGQSGGPIIRTKDNYVIAVIRGQTSNYNTGKRIHYDMYEWMGEW